MQVLYRPVSFHVSKRTLFPQHYPKAVVSSALINRKANSKLQRHLDTVGVTGSNPVSRTISDLRIVGTGKRI
jgi:hypothetical protein